MSTFQGEMIDSINTHLRDLDNVFRAHNTIHPDRDSCGGVGGCALMRVEHDTEQLLISTLKLAASKRIWVVAVGKVAS